MKWERRSQGQSREADGTVEKSGEVKRPETVTFYSYQKVWKIEKKIYAIQNLVLPMPIDPWFLLYFCITWGICALVYELFPVLSAVPGVIRSLLVPAAISRFFMTKKLDGKTPLRFLRDGAVYLLMDRGTKIERFHQTSSREKKEAFDWKCSRGDER